VLSVRRRSLYFVDEDVPGEGSSLRVPSRPARRACVKRSVEAGRGARGSGSARSDRTASVIEVNITGSSPSACAASRRRDVRGRGGARGNRGVRGVRRRR
jgi:hypothetical protein